MRLKHTGSWYKDGPYWRKPNADHSDGKGDLIFNTCNRIIEVNDTSTWAFTALIACGDLLRAGKRWPDRMNHKLDAESWVERIINRFLRRTLGIKYDWYEHRFQGRMSRDPYVAWAVLCLELDYRWLIETVSPAWYVRTPSFMAWWRFLITRNAKCERRYRFWDRFSLSKKDFVIRLGELRELGIELTEKR